MHTPLHAADNGKWGLDSWARLEGNIVFQVHLGDLPANISGRRLGDGIWRATLPRAVLLAASALGGIAGALTHSLPGVASLRLFSSCLKETMTQCCMPFAQWRA